MKHLLAICDFYTRLCQRGKPRKVVLVAVMRKLLLILNAVVRDQVPLGSRTACPWLARLDFQHSC